MSTLLQDLRFALRSFVRAPRFSVPAILALALGIGATSATMSVVRGVMLEPLPYRDPDRVVTIWETNPGRNIRRNVIGQSNFVAWRERTRSLEHLGMAGPARLSLIVGNPPEEVEGMFASSDVFAALGVEPAIGRAYTSNEDLRGNDQVMVVSHDFWQTRLGGRSDVAGTTIRVNGVPRTVIGVMPEGFTLVGQKLSYLIPYGWDVEQLRAAQGRGFSYGFARLRDGVTLEQARNEMRQLMAEREKEAPRLNTGWSALLVPVHEHHRPGPRLLHCQDAAGALGCDGRIREPRLSGPRRGDPRALGRAAISSGRWVCRHLSGQGAYFVRGSCVADCDAAARGPCRPNARC